MKLSALLICLVGAIPVLQADGFPVGTWVRRPNNDGITSTMLIEAAGTGRKFTMKVSFSGGQTSTMICTSQGDGKDAVVSVDGKPSGQTMAIRMIDDHHAVNILKVN